MAIESTKSAEDRERELAVLVVELEVVREVLIREKVFEDAVPTLNDCVNEAQRLLQHGALQGELNELSRRVPLLIYTSPHWAPPLIQGKDGRWVEPGWLKALTPAHGRMCAAAYELRVIGS